MNYFKPSNWSLQMKALFFSLLLFLLIGGQKLAAQQYKMAGGFRIGDSEGVAIKAFLNERHAAEFLWTFRNSGMQWTGLFEFHAPALVERTEGFFWYYGFGPHIGYNQGIGCNGDCFTQDTTQAPGGNLVIREVSNSRKKNYYAMGMNFIMGLEYRFISLPLTVGLEYKPLIEFFNRSQFNNQFNDFAISVKYTFIRN